MESRKKKSEKKSNDMEVWMLSRCSRSRELSRDMKETGCISCRPDEVCT